MPVSHIRRDLNEAKRSYHNGRISGCNSKQLFRIVDSLKPTRTVTVFFQRPNLQHTLQMSLPTTLTERFKQSVVTLTRVIVLSSLLLSSRIVSVVLESLGRCRRMMCASYYAISCKNSLFGPYTNSSAEEMCGLPCPCHYEDHESGGSLWTLKSVFAR